MHVSTTAMLANSVSMQLWSSNNSCTSGLRQHAQGAVGLNIHAHTHNCSKYHRTPREWLGCDLGLAHGNPFWICCLFFNSSHCYS